MNYQIVPYHRSLNQQCVELMSDTWNFNALFPDHTKTNLINRLFFTEATILADYSQVIIDQTGRVGGYLFGILDHSFPAKASRFWKTLGYGLLVIYHVLMGHVGPRKFVLKRGKELLGVMGSLDSKKTKTDGFVSLFFVSSTLRGQGLGKKLMENFESHCKTLGFQRIYLWTDKGCNYKFYEAQGFERIHSLSSPLLSQYGTEPNGYTYAKPLENQSPSPVGTY